MRIQVTAASKRFNTEWIFSNLNFNFTTGQHYALIGNNGSGKSTLLQIIAGYIGLTKGDIQWISTSNETIDSTNIFHYISIAAPYLELVEEFTALEQIAFHQQFKPLQNGLEPIELLEKIGLKNAAKKQIRNFSSGMKQRLKLALAIFDQAPILLLDEPCSNLDQEGIQTYHQLMQAYAMHKLIIVASNDPQEYQFCSQQLSLSNFKS
ncbi:MAG: ATP-binding cassette domain-containing protein [Chitinophagia bacterium]|nr:ATP-binding cassette domain-containing protein [Chitinophagia bacterium]